MAQIRVWPATLDLQLLCLDEILQLRPLPKELRQAPLHLLLPALAGIESRGSFCKSRRSSWCRCEDIGQYTSNRP